MYSLVIVEDEYTSRDRLQNMVKWGDMGFFVTAVFADGQEALDFLKYNTPNVILTDIRMIHKSGLDIARYVSEHELPTKVVLLSGYEEFEYAQKALQYHVSDYLTKPISLVKLKESFGRIYDQLQQQVAADERRRARAQHYHRLLTYEKQRFVTDAYYGAVSDFNRSDFLSGSAGKASCYLLQLSISCDDRYAEQRKNYGLMELQTQIIHCMDDLDPRFEFYFINWRSSDLDTELSLIGVFWESVTAEDAPRAELGPQPEGITGAVWEQLSLHTVVEEWKRLDSPAGLIHIGEEIGRNEPRDALRKNPEYLQMIRGQIALLLSYFHSDDRERGVLLTGTIVQNLLRAGIPFAQSFCNYIFVKLTDSIMERNLSMWNEFYLKYSTPDVFSCTHSRQIIDWLVSRMNALYDYQETISKVRSEKSIDKVLAYISEHFAEDICLSSVADAILLNPTYISRLVKEQTGRSFTSIVSEYRINKAITLLSQSELHVYEIAKQVGYINIKTFYKVFKDITGKSPGDYMPAASHST